MSRGLSLNRHHRNRIINKKLFIYRHILLIDLSDDFIEGRFSKGKVHCSCRMCKYEKYHGIERLDYRFNKNELKDYMYYKK